MSTSSPLNISDLFQCLSATVRHLQGYIDEVSGGPFGSAFYLEIAQGINAVADDVHVHLSRAGHVIALCDLIVNVHPSMRGIQPRGWPQGIGFEECAAVYHADQKVAEIAAFVEDPVAGVTPVTGAAGTLREELGHSLDHSLYWTSHAQNFLAAYRADVAGIASQADRTVLQYFLEQTHLGVQQQEADAVEEVFAVLFAIEHGGSGSLPSTQRLMAQTFQRCRQELLQVLASIP